MVATTLRDLREKVFKVPYRTDATWHRVIPDQETLFGSIKVERLNGMRFEKRRRAKDEIIDWLVWYNSRRLHSTLGYMSPMQYEQRWLAGQQKTTNL